MPSIQATRQEISDRFSVLGFNVRTNGRRWFEVVLATDPELFRSKDKRSARNFFSSRAHGPLLTERGESVYLVPPDVLRRFAGQPRVYYGLATFADANYSDPSVTQIPGPENPWVSIKAFTGKVPRRMLTLRTNGHAPGGSDDYGTADPLELTWAGDGAQPGIESAPGGNGHSKGNGNGKAAVPGKPNGSPESVTAGFAYDDGFGPLPFEAPADESESGIEGPIPDEAELAAAAQSYSRPFQQAAEYPQAAEFIPARFFRASKKPRTINRIVIHITDGATGDARATARYFQNPTRWLRVDEENGQPQMETDDKGVCRRFMYRGNGKDCVGGRTRTRNGHTEAIGVVEVSAHYAVGQDGTVVQMVRHADVAFHASSANGDSIGIEHNANPKNLPPSEAQYCASAALVRWLAEQFSVPMDRQHILGHSEADPKTSHTGCPNSVWDWSYFMGLVTSGSCYPKTTSSQGLGRPVRALDKDSVAVPIASRIAGAVMTRILNNEGDIKWELDQLKGLKYPHDDPKQAGSAAYQTTTTNIRGPKIENLLTDQISADFEIRWQYNGKSLGNIEITNTRTNDAVGWGLEVKATLSDDANVHGGRAALNVRFYYRFTRSLGSDQIGIFDLKLYADGNFDQNFRWTQSSSLAAGTAQPFAAPVVVPIATAIAGAVMTRILSNEGDIKWELDQLKGLKYPHDDPKQAGSASYQTTTTTITGPKIENLLTDQISADFEIRWQYNGKSLGNVEITNTGTNDAVGWGQEVKATISDDANVHGGRAALNVRFYYRFTRTIGSDHIGIFDLKLYADGKFDQNFRWTQSGSLGLAVTRPFAAPIIVPIVTTIAGAVMSRIINNEGDIKWELDQLKGLKHPHDDPKQAGSTAYQTTTTNIRGPKIENLLTDQISADFEIRWQYNGKSLGNIEITNTRTNDAVGWGLEVKATISDDANVHGRAAINVRFYYRFTRSLGSDQIGIFDLKLYADGNFDQNFRWTQSSSLGTGTAQPFAAPVIVPIATAIAGAVMTRILSNEGDIKWELDQLKGLKYPHDDPKQAGSASYQTTTTTITGPKIENLLTDQISADFEIRWQYNGKSLGNVEITNTGTNDAVGWGLEVKATIADDANVHGGRAALNVRFYYRFTRTIGSDHIGIFDLKLYADGKFDQNFRWTQSGSLGLAVTRPFAAPVVVPIATAIAGAVMTRILNNEGDIKWELDQLKGLKYPHDDPKQAGSAAYQTTTTNIRGPKIENLLTDQISADFEIRWQYNGKSLGNVEITNTRTNDAVGWGLEVKATISDDANVHGGRAALNVRFYYRFTRSLGSDQIGIFDLKLYADGNFDQNFRWTQSSSLGLAAGGSPKNGDLAELPPPPARRARALSGTEAAIAIGGVLLDRVVNNEGDVSWELDQFRGLKHPNDTAPSPPPTFQDAPTIRLADWPKAGGLVDEISAKFTVDWQYSGRSLGNIRISNVGVNDAVGWGLRVQAQIMDDNILYPPNKCAALRIRFNFHFTRSIGSTVIAVTDLHLYGDGTHERESRWEQASTLAVH